MSNRIVRIPDSKTPRILRTWWKARYVTLDPWIAKHKTGFCGNVLPRSCYDPFDVMVNY